MNVSQLNQILSHLRSGKSITALIALDKYDCFRLGARIYDLRQLGHKIEKQMIEAKSGKHVAKYWMPRESQ